MRRLRVNKTRIDSVKKGGKLQGGGKNHGVSFSGARGRRVSIPRAADSFKSRTDNT